MSKLKLIERLECPFRIIWMISASLGERISFPKDAKDRDFVWSNGRLLMEFDASLRNADRISGKTLRKASKSASGIPFDAAARARLI